jgi:hypothetical protein
MARGRAKKKTAPTAISEYLAAIGRKGGQAKVPKGAAALSPEERRERAKKMADARWGKKKKAS